MSERYETVQVNDVGDLHAWLLAHHAESPGVWLVRWKRGAGGPGGYFTYEEFVRELLTFGWIDSRGRGVDDERTSVLITPRRPTSGWSQANKEHVAALAAAGRLHPAGLAAVERAKANGSWELLDAVEQMIEPDDLREALDANPIARHQWEAFTRSTRRQFLAWIYAAKRPETRARRVKKTVSDAAEGRPLQPPTLAP